MQQKIRARMKAKAEKSPAKPAAKPAPAKPAAKPAPAKPSALREDYKKDVMTAIESFAKKEKSTSTSDLKLNWGDWDPKKLKDFANGNSSESLKIMSQELHINPVDYVSESGKFEHRG